MTKKYYIEIELTMLLLLAAGIGITLAMYGGNKSQFPTKIHLPVMQVRENPTATPTPSVPKPEVVSQISPDGSKMLTMTVTANKDLTKMYTFVTSESNGGNPKTIYTTPYTTDSMSIPFNTWSPDDTYVFLIYSTPTGTQALVMRADGQPLSDTEITFNAATIFNDKNTGNTYQETTGWASDTLLIINTTLQDKTKGPSYWLEIPSKALIQLSSQF